MGHQARGLGSILQGAVQVTPASLGPEVRLEPLTCRPDLPAARQGCRVMWAPDPARDPSEAEASCCGLTRRTPLPHLAV